MTEAEYHGLRAYMLRHHATLSDGVRLLLLGVVAEDAEADALRVSHEEILVRPNDGRQSRAR